MSFNDVEGRPGEIIFDDRIEERRSGEGKGQEGLGEWIRGKIEFTESGKDTGGGRL